jgi:ADP-heptose:LPS heptosyltransferase
MNVPRPAVVVLRALGLGDFLTAVPAYRGLRRCYPDHEIVLAAPAALAPLAGWTGAIDRVLPTGELRPLAWSGPPPGLAVNLHGRGPESHRLLSAVPARRRVGFRRSDAPTFEGPAWLPGEHEVRRWCRLLAAVGVPCEPTDLLLRPPRSSTRHACAEPSLPPFAPWSAPAAPPVVVHPGAGAPARRWPAARFAALARGLAAGGWPVVLTGSAAEQPLAQHVARLAGLPDAAVLAGRTGPTDLARLVARAALVVCGDTGIGHLATATATPSVLLFGPTPPAEWGPLRDLDKHLVLWTGYSGDPHGTCPHRGLLAIGVTEVLAAARTLLARARSHAPAAVGQT